MCARVCVCVWPHHRRAQNVAYCASYEDVCRDALPTTGVNVLAADAHTSLPMCTLSGLERLSQHTHPRGRFLFTFLEAGKTR